MKKSLSVLIALVCGTLATVLASRYLNAQSEGSTIAMTDIFVAITAIDVGDEITPEKIKLEQWPTDKVPGGSTGDLKILEGKFARQRFYEGEAIMPVKLMDDNWTEVPRNYRVVAMNASDSGIANLIQPGDRVDVTAFFDQSEIIPNSTTQTVLRGVRVYALDGDTQRRDGKDRPKNLRNIQLLIHESETSAWELAQQLGKVNLLVSSDADSDADTRQSAGKFVTWLTDMQQQRDAKLAAKQDRQTFKPQPNSMDPQTLPTAPTPVKVKSFKMTKLSGGRIIEYSIPPGQMPKIIGEVGDLNESAVSSVPSSDYQAGGFSGEAVSGSDDPFDTAANQAEYGYLNGQNSPFFQSE